MTSKVHTRVTIFQGVKTTKVYDLTKKDQESLGKIEKLQEHSMKLPPTYSDDSIQDYLMELWLEVLNECKLISVKEEKMHD